VIERRMASGTSRPAAGRLRDGRSHDDYEMFCAELERLCAIDLSQYKRRQMERRVRHFVEHRGAPSLSAYVELLRGDAGELDRFLDRVTINVSQLWRHPEQWELLRRRILPELAERGEIRAWSAGCSYGAEAYTLAAVCRDAVPHARVRIQGTDIDRRMIARANEPRFTAEDARGAPADAVRRHFERDGEHWVPHADLRAMVAFGWGDLLRMTPPHHAFDLVLCRNTVIYFTEPVRDALHARLARALRPGGYLIVGATERVTDPPALGLEPAHPFTYRRAA